MAAERDKTVVFDEIHKYSRWKQFLKGFYDLYDKQLRIVATGSARMDVYKKGGDSMMGRYFPYRMHPFSVAELLDVSLPGDKLVRAPRRLEDGEPWFLVEAKKSDTGLSGNLDHFQRQTGARHTFQVVVDTEAYMPGETSEIPATQARIT